MVDASRDALGLEARVLMICDRVTQAQPIEDSSVELKREWISPTEAARQLAGHCNAAYGDPVLWLIGVDEKSHSISGATERELAAWKPQVDSHFDGLAPALLRHLNVLVAGKTVAALLFESDRAPYVVKNPVFGQPGAGPVQYHIPWREGSRVRSARREDLIRLLGSARQALSLDLEWAALTWQSHEQKLELSANVYVIAPESIAIIRPRYCAAECSFLDGSAAIELSEIHLQPLRRDDPKVNSGSSDVSVSEAGLIRLIASAPDPIGIPKPERVAIRMTIRSLACHRPVSISEHLTFDSKESNSFWYIWTLPAAS